MVTGEANKEGEREASNRRPYIGVGACAEQVKWQAHTYIRGEGEIS